LEPPFRVVREAVRNAARERLLSGRPPACPTP